MVSARQLLPAFDHTRATLPVEPTASKIIDAARSVEFPKNDAIARNAFTSMHYYIPDQRLTVTTNDGAIDAALRGFGITRMLSYQVSPYVMAGQLRTILEEHEPAPRPIHIVHREGRHASAKVRAFVDLTAERLRADRALS